MTCKISRAHLLGVTFPLIISLITLLAPACLGQTAVNAPLRRSSTEKANHAAQGSGNPLFVPAVPYNSGGEAIAVAVADVNGDGKPDLVVANLSSPTVAVLLGNGDGTFQAAVTYPVVGYSPDSIAVADLNGDGKPDVAVATGVAPIGWSSNLSVFLGNGDGTFQPAVGYGCGDASGIAIADANGDGKQDLLMTISNGYGLAAVLMGNGDGTFQPCATYSSGGTYPYFLTVGDLNGDGKPDLVVANWFALKGKVSTVGVLLGNGDGTFQPGVTYYSGGNQLGAVAAADLRGDGKLDVVGANCVPAGSLACGDKKPPHGVLGVLLGNGDGTLQPVVAYDPGGAGTSGVAITDVDGDGKLDVVVTNPSGSIGVLLGNGDGTFQRAITYTTTGLQPYSVVARDVNGDGRPDLIIVASDGIAVMLNNTGPHTATTTMLTASENPVKAGTPVTFTASVAGAPNSGLTGTVTFQDGPVIIATVALSGNQAACRTTYTGKHNGIHSIMASYSGDLHNSVSTSAALPEDVLAPSRMTVTTSQSPAPASQPVTFTATIKSTFSAISDGEMVTFYSDSMVIGTGLTAGGKATFTTSSLTVGKHSIKAAYPGDTLFEPSSGKIEQVVQK